MLVKKRTVLNGTNQSQKTQGFCIADFATLYDERKSRSKIFPLFIWMKEPCVRKFEGLARSKRLGISQTIMYASMFGGPKRAGTKFDSIG